MTDSRSQQDPAFDAIAAECTRIGFDIRALGTLAFAGEDALVAFQKLLKEIPSGVGLDGLRERVPDVAPMSEEEMLRELTRDDPTTCSFCGREKTHDRRLMSGPNRIAICSECVRLAAELFEE